MKDDPRVAQLRNTIVSLRIREIEALEERARLRQQVADLERELAEYRARNQGQEQ